MNQLDKLRKVILEYNLDSQKRFESKQFSFLTFEEWLEKVKYPNQMGYWLELAKHCGFMTGAECRRVVQSLLN